MTPGLSKRINNAEALIEQHVVLHILGPKPVAVRLQRRMPMVLAGAVAQDGGVAINNLSAQISGQEWLPLAKEFFLS